MKDKKISKKRISISVISLLMALLMVCLAGCNKDNKDNSSSSGSGGIVITPDDSSDTESENTAPKLELPTRTDEVKSAKDANKDVVGWLYIPGLTDVDRGFQKAGVISSETERKGEPVTKLDLFEVGLSGGSNSAEKRSELLKYLGMPELMTTNAMLEIINTMMSRDEFMDIIKKLSQQRGETDAF